jgi:hypothetical protein
MPNNAETKSHHDEISSSPNEKHYSKHDTFINPCLFSGIVIMIIWPWFFFAATWGGLKLHGHVGTFVGNSSQQVSFIVTLIAGTINLVIVYLFSQAVASLARKQIVREDATISHITFFITLRNRSLPSSLFRQGRLILFWTVILYIVAFAFITPGIATLLLPIRFIRSVSLNGTELDFASHDPDCVNWFHRNSSLYGLESCDWLVSLRSNYAECAH